MNLHSTQDESGLQQSNAIYVNRKKLSVPPGQRRPLRVALYSHDTMGLGHARRNLLLAQAIAEGPENVDILLITGNRETSTFPMPMGTDCLTIPSVYKSPDGSYRSRRMDLPLRELITLRSGLIKSALESFCPDVFIVDNVPRGVSRELDPALEAMRERGATRCILGLRDVLDSPSVVAWEWTRNGNFDAIRRYFYQIWVFGDQAVYNPVSEYGFPLDIAGKIRFAGYLDQRERLAIAGCNEPDPLDQFNFPVGELALCLVGGGQDGMRVAETFARTSLPEGMNGVVLTGPFMPQEFRSRLYQQAEANDRMGVLEFVPEPGVLIERARRIVAMGGYNTVCEVLSHDKHALIVPRVRPREEQFIRAARMSGLGLLDMCHPDELTPEVVSTWLSQPDRGHIARADVDLNGFKRVPLLLERVMHDNGEPLHNYSGGGQQHVVTI
jgi:predicted glycosyltransferase